MGFAKQWKGVNEYMIRSPGTFFSEYDERHGVGYPIAFMLASYIAVMLPVAALSVVLNITTPGDAAIGVVLFLLLGILAWVLGLVEALLAHLIVYLFGGRGLSKTLEAYAFPTVVRNVLWWLPLINLVLGFYGFYLQIRGLAAFHDISTGKAAVASILAALLYFIPVIVILAAVIAAFVLELGEPSGVQQPAMLLASVV